MEKQIKENTDKLIYEKPEMISLPLKASQAVLSDCSPGAEVASPWHPCKSMKT